MFSTLLNQHKNLINYAANRYQIPGVLLKDDLFQEGLIALHVTVETSKYPWNSDEFVKQFKTKLFQSMINQTRKSKAKSRDYRFNVRNTYADDKNDNIVNLIDQLVCKNPSYSTKLFIMLSECDKFIRDLRGRLLLLCESSKFNVYNDSIRVLDLLLSEKLEPTIINRGSYKTNVTSVRVIANNLSWGQERARRAISKLRYHAKKLVPKYFGG